MMLISSISSYLHHARALRRPASCRTLTNAPLSSLLTNASILRPSSQRQQQRQPPEHPHHQRQQERTRMTKAKKLAAIRRRQREVWAERGKSVPLPGNYTPRDTHVVNSISKEDRKAEHEKYDSETSQELQRKREHQEKENPIILRHHMTGMTMSDRVRKLFMLHNGNQREVVAGQKLRGMELFQIRPADTGSSAVQIIALTSRIQQLTTHLNKHKKDKHGRRGLQALYVRRRKLLDYMERKDHDNYRRVVKTLGLVRK